jgi:amino acid adenylation domain-containing protein
MQWWEQSSIMPSPLPAVQNSGIDSDVLEFEPGEVDGSIASRFEKVTRQFPERLAVKSSRYAWSYATLNNRANWLAQSILAERGGEPEPVAVLCEHEAPIIAAILGVLKSGKFFVSLDASFPITSLRTILDDLQPALIISDEANLHLAQDLAYERCNILAINTQDDDTCSTNPTLNLTGAMTYGIFYTSGSTGQPKGVQRNQSQELQRAWHDKREFDICPTDHQSVLTSFSFITASADMMRAILNGATLCMFDIRKYGVSRLVKWIDQESITSLCLPPTFLRALISSLPAEQRFSSVRLTILLGDVLFKNDIERARHHFPPDSVFVNILSGSEAGRTAMFKISRDIELKDPIVPAGYPVEGKEVWILDESGMRLGFDEIGEIAVRSRFLARGYWHQTELTQASFLPDPEASQKRIYLTGDLGRMRPDGCLEFLGRKDFMVKIRGYRVELAAVEAALHELGLFKDAVVVAQPDPSGEKRLVAYLVPANQPTPTANALRDRLAEKLPTYMAPSAFVFVETIPLTPTGKPDRQALPLPDQSRPMLAQPYAPARNALEATLVAMWGQMLGVEPVGKYDNFLDLGGNSLLAIRIIARVQELFRVEVPLSKLFELPTIAELAVFIAEAQNEQETDAELEKLLQEVEGLSEQEVEERLAGYQRQKGVRQER